MIEKPAFFCYIVAEKAGKIIVKFRFVGKMMAEVNLKEAYIKYLDILNSGCENDIQKAKYNLLFEAISCKMNLRTQGNPLLPRGVGSSFRDCNLLVAGAQDWRLVFWALGHITVCSQELVS